MVTNILYRKDRTAPSSSHGLDGRRSGGGAWVYGLAFAVARACWRSFQESVCICRMIKLLHKLAWLF